MIVIVVSKVVIPSREKRHENKHLFPEGKYGIMKTVSSSRTFFVEANVHAHVGV